MLIVWVRPLPDKEKRAILVSGRGGQWCCETSRLPHSLEIRSQMAVSLSAFRAGRALSPARFPVLISIRGRVDPRDYSVAGRIR
jgi:hypothetical protein